MPCVIRCLSCASTEVKLLSYSPAHAVHEPQAGWGGSFTDSTPVPATVEYLCESGGTVHSAPYRGHAQVDVGWSAPPGLPLRRYSGR